MKSYNLRNLSPAFIKAFIFTVVLAIIGGIGMFGYAKHKQKTTYTAERFVLVSHDINENKQATSYNQSITVADLNMMPSYEDIIENEQVAQNARKYLPAKLRKHYSASDISTAISAKSRQQSLVLKVSAETSSPTDSVSIVNAVTKSFEKQLPKIQPGAGQVHLLAKATKENVSSSTTPSKKKYLVAGVALGGLVGIIISFVAITWRKLLH